MGAEKRPPEKVQKFEYTAEPDEGSRWQAGNADHLVEAKERAKAAVEAVFTDVQAANPGFIDQLRIGGVTKKC